MNHARQLCVPLLWLGITGTICGQIPKPDDAPRPLSPDESVRRFKVPEGFRIELVASEPLIREPSGVCWDERGQLFVCELHGYNLEGQHDIEELNRTGRLDRVVRRIQADERHTQAAEAETYGTIKQLHDVDGDGRMDRAEIWADRLPPCLGICPARGGIIAACQTQILFLADRDDDGRAEVCEVMFEGFAKGPLERSINCPQWGPDLWIYVGRGSGGGTIRGGSLKQPVQLPHTDFRIKPDGTAIEPVAGGTQTMGFTFTESGDGFVISTREPGIFVAPLEWRYLARNPDVAAPPLEQSATSDQRVYPTSKPHPWRTRRAADPGFSEYYSDRYGIAESAPNGYFTSACSARPLPE
jgi:putative membrane-bound dehydrogenase-like protein